ncbi:glycosyltransferase family 25 protein [Lentzea cavernae]|uniref:glycosyltransferase family 25 protein n=1 Tax=Lentzea cavernae TaxID=2020703 RepID=UPI001E347C9A|nr:glycosyltransferase family 25 protein [Lentzea cavernae]
MVNLPRRLDRRSWIEQALPTELAVTFTSDLNGPFDGRSLTHEALDAAGHQLFSWQIESDNPWWNRPLKYGEIGCTLAHLACWRDAADHGDEPYVVVLEDDAVVPAGFLTDLLDGLDRLEQARSDFDLLYLGRFPLEPDREAAPGFVVPGYSHCTFGYLLTRKALHMLLVAKLDHAIVPVDEFLPAQYIDHPRGDLRARFPKRLAALAFEPPLVHQRPKDEAGSDTEDSEFVVA